MASIEFSDGMAGVVSLFEEEGKKLEIGYKIAKLRQKFGLTQKQLAERIKTSQGKNSLRNSRILQSKDNYLRKKFLLFSMMKQCLK